jgi:hypothetical protein
MGYNLFLDDVRQPQACCNYVYPVQDRPLYHQLEWEIVRNYEDFVLLIQDKGLPELVSFDHDLAEIHYVPGTWTEGFVYQEKTGYDCAKWLVDYCLENKTPLPKFLSHSMNPIGRERILSLLTNFKNHQDEQKQA